MRLTGLTQKQEAFCQAFASGKTGIESYMAAYDTTNKYVANNESGKLLRRDDITKRIRELRKPIENHIQNVAISERKKQIEEIKERIEICKMKEDEASLIRYYDMLNKLHGLYKDTDDEQQTENALAKLDTSSLYKVLDA